MSAPEPQPDRRSRLLYPLLLVGLVAVFLSPYVFLGRSMLPLEFITLFQPWARHARELWTDLPPIHNPLLDPLLQYYPQRAYMQDALGAGWLPLWNPFTYGGSSFVGIQQSAVLYPPAWLLALLAPALQFGWSALLHLSLAAIGTFYLLRHLGLRAAAALVGAVAFPFNGYVVVWLAYPNVTQWTLCWLPLALYLWERGRSEDDLRWIAAAALAVALSVMGGHGQASAYVLLTWGAWTVFRSVTAPRPLRALGRWVVLPTVLALGLALGHMLPGLDYLPRTDRGARVPWTQAAASGMPVSQLWTFVLPRLFGDGTREFSYGLWIPLGGKANIPAFPERSFYPGVAVLVLAGGAWAVRDREQRRLALFFAVLVVLAVLLALGTPLYWPLWRFAPGFGNVRAIARIVGVAALPLAGLAALGVHALTAPEGEARRRALYGVLTAGALAALVALIGYFIYEPLAPEGVDTEPLTRGLLLSLVWAAAPALLAALVLPRRGGEALLKPALAGALAVLVVAADLFAFGFGYNPASDPALLAATTPELQAVQEAQAREEPFRFLSAGPLGQEMDLKQRMPSGIPSAFGLPDIGGSDPFVSNRYRAWESATARAAGGGSPWSPAGSPNLRSAAVRYYLTGARERLANLREVVGTGLQEDPAALPYARLHGNAQRLSERELLANLSLTNRAPQVALVSGADAPVFNGPPLVAPFRARRLNGNRVVVEGEAPVPGLLVVSEQYDPGWRVRVDGQPARMVPADHLLSGVPLDAGRHRIELTYAPDSFRVGLFGTLVALAVLCGLLVGARRVRTSRRA